MQCVAPSEPRRSFTGVSGGTMRDYVSLILELSSQDFSGIELSVWRAHVRQRLEESQDIVQPEEPSIPPVRRQLRLVWSQPSRARSPSGRPEARADCPSTCHCRSSLDG